MMKKCCVTAVIALSALVLNAGASPDHGWETKAPVDVSSIPVAKAIAPRKSAVTTVGGGRLMSARLLGASPTTLDLGLPPDNDGRIAECARGLRHDWQRCFDFVRDNIAFSQCAGILRGPVRTLIDREGSDADQALLLMALLKASGYADVRLVYEPAEMTSEAVESGFVVPFEDVSGYTAVAWLSLPTNTINDVTKDRVRHRLSSGGHEVINYSSEDGAFAVITDHYWVELTVDGVKHSLDPSFKPTPGKNMPDVLAQMRYNRSSLLSSVGGSVDASSVKNLSEGNLTTALKGYAKNLSEAWTNANWSAEDYLGVGTIVPRRSGDPRFPGTSISGSPIDVFGQGTSSVNARRARANLTLDGTSLVSFYLDEIGLRNLWLSYEQNGSALQAVLHLDDQVLKTVSSASSGKATLRIAVDYAHGETTKDYSFSRKAGNAYSVIVGFGSDARGGMRKFATGELARLKNAGHTNDSRRMLAAMTYSAGHHWMAECAAIQKIRNCVLGGDEGMYYDVGISGQDGGPYVDMANRMGFGQKNITHFNGSSFFDSALEHSILEQLNGSECPAVSTVKILSLANASGNPVYFMNSGNVSSVIPLLQNYSIDDLTEFRSFAAGNEIVLAPKNANTTLNQWSGMGYVSFGPITEGASRVHTGMIISGGYNGGYSSLLRPSTPMVYLINMLRELLYLQIDKLNLQGDPLAMPYGNFVDAKQDLVLNRATPLTWTRRYDSSESYFDGALGRGWSHNFDARIMQTTDFDSFFGRGSAQAVVPSTVVTAIIDDLLRDQKSLAAGENARRFTLSALAIKWWTDQLCNTAVMVKLGSMSLGFTRNPDGTYAPAPGVTAGLTKNGDEFSLQERNGSTYVFNADGLLSSKIDTSGNTTRLTYANGKLAKVENDFDASLTVNWTGERISSVSDNVGRSVSYTYDANGCLVKTTDSNGKAWTSTYDTQSHALLTKTNPDGQRIIKNTYNEYRQVTNQVSDIGQSWSFGYVSCCEAWDRDPLGNYLAKKYDHCGRVCLQTERDGSTSRFIYDGHSHLIGLIDAAGHLQHVAYNADDNMVSFRDGTGTEQREARFVYDSQKRLSNLINAMGQSRSLTYDNFHRVTRITDYDGSYVANTWTSKGLLSESKSYTPSGRCKIRKVYEYGAYGLPTASTIYGDGLPVAGYRMTMTYTGVGRIASMTDANGRTSTLTYDNEGRLLSASDALGRTVSHAYTASGYLKSVTDAMGHTTARTVTASGNPAVVTAADGGVVRNTYNAVDDLISVENARGITATLTRDAVGRVVKAATPIGSFSVEYDILGNPVSTTNAVGIVTKVEYDSLSRPVVTIDGKGNRWQTSYDALDRAISATTPLGKTTRAVYDKLSRRTATIRPSGARNAFGYDDSGALSVYTNAEGAVYRIFHDALGRVTAITNAVGNGLFSATYDGVGNLLTRTDGTGGMLTFGYDACNRLVTKQGATLNASFAYDNADNITSAANATASEAFTYDVCNRLTRAQTTVGDKSFDSSYAYDLGGFVTNVTYASGKNVTRTYDADGRLASVSDWLGHTWRMTYDADGKLLSLASPNGVTASRSYDEAGRLAAWDVGEIAGRTFVRDAMGRKVSESVSKGKLPILPSARKAENVHNAADQLLSSTVEKDGVTVNESYTYDGDGALTRATATAADAVTFGYTAERQLASVSCGGTSVSFGYDALGNRLVANGTYWIPDFTDPLKRPLMECSSSGAVMRYYIWGGARLLGFIDANGVLTVAHGDDYGSVIALTDISGNVQWRASYGPHGEDCGTTGTNPTPFAWLGGFGVQRLDIDSFMGTIYNTRYRLYSVNQHRFLSSDPMGLNGGLNLYSYGSGNAVAYIDPLGLCNILKSEDFWHGVIDQLADDVIGFLQLGDYASPHGLNYLLDDIAKIVSDPQGFLNGITDELQFYARTMTGHGSDYDIGRGMVIGGEMLATLGLGALANAAAKGATVATKTQSTVTKMVPRSTLRGRSNVIHAENRFRRSNVIHAENRFRRSNTRVIQDGNGNSYTIVDSIDNVSSGRSSYGSGQIITQTANGRTQAEAQAASFYYKEKKIKNKTIFTKDSDSNVIFIGDEYIPNPGP